MRIGLGFLFLATVLAAPASALGKQEYCETLATIYVTALDLRDKGASQDATTQTLLGAYKSANPEIVQAIAGYVRNAYNDDFSDRGKRPGLCLSKFV